MNINLNKMSIHIDKYYELKFNDELGEYDHYRILRYADDVRDILVDAVKVRLISDVPVGSCLSGGLDSSSIVVIINKLLREGSIQGKQIGRKDKIGFLTPVETWIKHKDSLIPLLMKQYGLNKYDPYFAWKFHIGSIVIH